ncbi:MAG TPA: hypothetical protein VGS22_20325 [Thermoanaerobaculia bacterium]|jgi:hypothetical protein|nr:hypothetical protein [Thermoanaerobaculia bacterium]
MKKKLAKLSLHRETVRELLAGEALQAFGGVTPTDPRVCTANSCPNCTAYTHCGGSNCTIIGD